MSNENFSLMHKPKNDKVDSTKLIFNAIKLKDASKILLSDKCIEYQNSVNDISDLIKDNFDDGKMMKKFSLKSKFKMQKEVIKPPKHKRINKKDSSANVTDYTVNLFKTQKQAGKKESIKYFQITNNKNAENAEKKSSPSKERISAYKAMDLLREISELRRYSYFDIDKPRKCSFLKVDQNIFSINNNPGGFLRRNTGDTYIRKSLLKQILPSKPRLSIFNPIYSKDDKDDSLNDSHSPLISKERTLKKYPTLSVLNNLGSSKLIGSDFKPQMIKFNLPNLEENSVSLNRKKTIAFEFDNNNKNVSNIPFQNYNQSSKASKSKVFRAAIDDSTSINENKSTREINFTTETNDKCRNIKFTNLKHDNVFISEFDLQKNNFNSNKGSITYCVKDPNFEDSKNEITEKLQKQVKS